MRVLLLLLLVAILTIPNSAAGATSGIDFYLHQGSCVSYPSPCVVISESQPVQMTPASFTINQSSPVMYLGLVPSVHASGLILNSGDYTLHLWVSRFEQATVDPYFMNISMVRGSESLANQSFTFNPSPIENNFTLNSVPSSTGTPSLYLLLNITGSGITSLTVSFDSQDNPSRLSTAGFQYTGVPVFSSVQAIALMILLSISATATLRLHRITAGRAT